MHLFLKNEQKNQPKAYTNIIISDQSNDCVSLIEISENLHVDLTKIIEMNRQNIDENPFVKVFWDQQQQNMQSNPKGRRWHPLLVKWCLFLQYK